MSSKKIQPRQYTKTEEYIQVPHTKCWGGCIWFLKNTLKPPSSKKKFLETQTLLLCIKHQGIDFTKTDWWFLDVPLNIFTFIRQFNTNSVYLLTTTATRKFSANHAYYSQGIEYKQYYFYPKATFMQYWRARTFAEISGADPDYIHLCKYWSHICSGKVLKKIPEYSFSPTNYFIVFFRRSKRLKRLRPRYAVVILENLSNVFACLPCGKNCFSRKYSKIQ